MTTDALLGISDLPHQLPRFEDIDDDDYAPAIEAAMAEQLAAVAAITADPAAPTFANTLVPLELSGTTLARVLRVFWNKASADANPDIDAVRAAFAPRLAAHSDAILLDPALWTRLQEVYADRAALAPESAYLVERYVTELRLAGAALGEDDKARLRELNERISSQETAFELALQADSNDLAVVVDDPATLDGLTPGELSAAAAAAQARGLDGRHLLTLVLQIGRAHV